MRTRLFRIGAVFLPAICATFTAYTIPRNPQPALDNVWSIKVCTGPAWAQFCGIRAIDEVCCLRVGTVCLGVMAGQCYVFDTAYCEGATDLRRIFASNNTDYGFKNRETAILSGTVP